jgi:glycosyltransferase involved in cell wall biosynthesis
MKDKTLKILYHFPFPETVYAGKFIYEGYKSAFTKLGHTFYTLTHDDNLNSVLERIHPDIFISSLHRYALKFLDLDLLKLYRKKYGLIYFNSIPTWKKLSNQPGCSNLEKDGELVSLIKKGMAGDAFYYWIEQDSPYMEGFTKNTGYPYHTILLAADTERYYFDPDPKYAHDISYVGHYLKEKRIFINNHLLPLKKEHDVGIYGSDWVLPDRLLGYFQKGAQYFNIPYLKSIRKVPLICDRKVYSSTTINLNIHGDFQSLNGSDINERTFKILACGGFEICDNVGQVRKYFTEKELVAAKDPSEWFEKIEYFLKYPEKRLPYIEAGRKKVLAYHTYINRANQFIDIYHKLNGNTV